MTDAPNPTVEAWRRALALVPGILGETDAAGMAATAELAPIFAERGEGPWLYDSAGHRFCDTMMAWGALLLGYRHPRVEEAIASQLRRGLTFSVPTMAVGELAERLVAMLPGAEQVAFGKNGSDATLLAVRLARAATGKNSIAVCSGHFHGFHDWYAVKLGHTLGMQAGSREALLEIPYNDAEAARQLLRRHHKTLAAIILEPLRDQQPSPSYLHSLMDYAHRYGVLVIFDEMVTGFRLAPGGAAELLGVVPDLACYGKSLANGLPLSCVAGPRDLMALAPKCFVSMTYQYEQLAFAAALAVMEEIADGRASKLLWQRGAAFKARVEAAAERLGLPIRLVGPAPRQSLWYAPADAALLKPGLTYLLERLMARSVLANGNFLFSTAHGDAEIAFVAEALERAMEELADALATGTLRERLVIPFPIV